MSYSWKSCRKRKKRADARRKKQRKQYLNKIKSALRSRFKLEDYPQFLNRLVAGVESIDRRMPPSKEFKDLFFKSLMSLSPQDFRRILLQPYLESSAEFDIVKHLERVFQEF